MNKKIAAWTVHAYTSAGGIIGLFALFEASQDRLHSAFLLLLATVFIDATDGTLARTAQVKQVLPNFSGAEIDNVIDFFTYVWVPVFIMWKANLLPHPALCAVPVFAALYAYGQVNMKSADGYFIGFPSYWNIVALYLFWLQPNSVIASLMVLVPGVLSFIPTKYLYPSRGGFLWRTTYIFTAIWGIVLIYMLLLTEPPRWLLLASLSYPAYYMIASFYIDMKTRRSTQRLVEA